MKLKRILPFVITVVVIVAIIGIVKIFNENNKKAVEDYISYYYKRQNSDILISVLDSYIHSPIYKDKTQSKMPMVCFFSYAVKDNQKLIDDLYEYASSKGYMECRLFVAHIFWFLNTSETKALLLKSKKEWIRPNINETIDKMLNNPPKDYLTEVPVSGADLDCLWSIFLATGSKEPVRQIISVISLSKEGKGIEMIVGGAALWSLKSNAYQHEIVYDTVVEELEVSNGVKKELLESIIKEINNQ